MKPAQIPKTKYKEPISLWLVETNQRRGEESEGKGEIKLRPEKRIKHPPDKDYKIGSLMNYIYSTGAKTETRSQQNDIGYIETRLPSTN